VGNVLGNVQAAGRRSDFSAASLRVRDNVGMTASVNVQAGGATAGGFSPTESYGGGTAIMGVSQDTLIAVPAPEPGLHPPPDSSLFVSEGLTAGFAVAAVYVVSRAVGDTFKGS
jgi:hypothetical protein